MFLVLLPTSYIFGDNLLIDRAINAVYVNFKATLIGRFLGDTNEQKWEIEKIKVNKCYRIMMAVVFTSLFLLAMLLCYIIIGDYAIRDYAYVWVLVYIILYIVLVGSMRIAVTEYILDCKPVGNLFPKTIPLQFIERTVIVKGKLNKVIVYYNNGKKVVLHPEDPEAFVEKIKPTSI